MTSAFENLFCYRFLEHICLPTVFYCSKWRKVVAIVNLKISIFSGLENFKESVINFVLLNLQRRTFLYTRWICCDVFLSFSILTTNIDKRHSRLNCLFSQMGGRPASNRYNLYRVSPFLRFYKQLIPPLLFLRDIIFFYLKTVSSISFSLFECTFNFFFFVWNFHCWTCKRQKVYSSFVYFSSLNQNGEKFSILSEKPSNLSFVWVIPSRQIFSILAKHSPRGLSRLSILLFFCEVIWQIKWFRYLTTMSNKANTHNTEIILFCIKQDFSSILYYEWTIKKEHKIKSFVCLFIDNIADSTPHLKKNKKRIKWRI